MSGKLAFRLFDVVLVVLLLASGVLWYVSVMRHLSDDGSTSTAAERPAQVAGSSETDTEPTPTTTPTPPESKDPAAPMIALSSRTLQGRPFETIRIDGEYRKATGASTPLRVQRREGGDWVSFPLPVVPDARGRFTAYVELGRPGSYRLRVIEPENGDSSRVAQLTIG